jgi:hypothetical protein
MPGKLHFLFIVSTIRNTVKRRKALLAAFFVAIKIKHEK